jgi:threonine aldolase
MPEGACCCCCDGVQVHMDGARLPNAVEALGVSAADMTWRCGVDTLSLGATKGGTLAAEAVVLFGEATVGGGGGGMVAGSDGHELLALARRRKRAGHELSKSRFVGAQLQAFFGEVGGVRLWERSAAHANSTGAQLGRALLGAAGGAERGAGASPIDVRLQHPLQTNQVFLSVASDGAGRAAVRRLCSRVGAVPWESTDRARLCVRLVTAFDTTPEEIEQAGAALVGSDGDDDDDDDDDDDEHPTTPS